MGAVTGNSNRADVEGFRALAAGADLELDSLALVVAAVAIALDVGVVDEYVFISFDGDESEPLLAIKKLYGTTRHEFTFVASLKNRALIDTAPQFYDQNRPFRSWFCK